MPISNGSSILPEIVRMTVNLTCFYGFDSNRHRQHQTKQYAKMPSNQRFAWAAGGFVVGKGDWHGPCEPSAICCQTGYWEQ